VTGATDETCRRIVEIVARTTGVDVAGRLEGRLKAHVEAEVSRLRLPDEQGYLAALESGEALDALLAAVLVHETFFYRYRSQIEALETRIIPEVLASQPPTLRIWSAGCSRGPEAYTLAMVATRAVERSGAGAAVDVLGTDVSSVFLAEAREAVYRGRKIEDLPADLRSRFLTRRGDGSWAVAGPLRDAVRFTRHNLLDPSPGSGFHVISCRNVLMYLGSAQRRRALEHLSAAIAPGGFLLMGHAESLRDVPDLFTPDRLPVGIYRGASARTRPAAPARRRSTRPPGRGPSRRPPTVKPAGPGPLYIPLSGDYDVERSPGNVDALRARLSEAVQAGGVVLVDADGADVLDRETGRIVARAEKTLRACGGRLLVRAAREAVRRWAERNALPLEGAGEASP